MERRGLLKTRNLLEEWKAECDYLSSIFNYNKKINLRRSDVESVYGVLIDYFGSRYFIPDQKPNWIHSLLANHDKPACIAGVYELASMITYLKSLNKSIQKNFKSLFKDPSQMRDMFFEVFIYRLLDFNKVENKKKTKEGRQVQEGTCLINGIEFLFECRKLYAPNFVLLNTIRFSLETLYLKLGILNKGFGFIGTIKFKNKNDEQNQAIVESKIQKFIEGYNTEPYIHTIDYHDMEGSVEFSVINYSEINNFEIEKDHYEYDVIFKNIPPVVTVPGMPNYYYAELTASFGIPRSKIYGKLLSAITEKRQQHAGSRHKNKIYFIDSEAIPSFNFAIFQVASMFDEEEISKVVDDLSEGEILCFIRRDYMSISPKVIISTYGKNIDPVVKKHIENLQTQFDYQIDIS